MTQKTKVIRMMIQHPEVEWWYPYFFLPEHYGKNEHFVGYKAPTRFCELCLDYPEMIESKMDDKYRIGRFRYENYPQFMESVRDKSLKKLIDYEMARHSERQGVGVQEPAPREPVF